MTSARHFRNPISLAKLVMKDSYHCGLSGEGALKFANEKGFPAFYDKEQLISQRSKNMRVSYQDFVKYVDCRIRGLLVGETDEDSCCKAASAVAVGSSGNTASAVANDNSCDTVSAVARDANGYFACAVSTGMNEKMVTISYFSQKKLGFF